MSATALRVGGFVPFTSIDYPGELAAVVFCQGCPWRCSYCHNPHLLPGTGEHLLSWVGLVDELKRRRAFLDAVVFSGGEPTAQSTLAQAIQDTKALGYKIGLHTAGCYPQRLEKILPLLDWVGLDIKDMPDRYDTLTGAIDSGHKAWQSLELLLQAGIPLQVRTTVHPDMDASVLATLSASLSRLGVMNHELQNCR